MGDISMPKLLRQIENGDLDPTELWVGGEITEHLQGTEYERVNKRPGVKEVVDALKEKITQDLSDSNNTEEN